jgi:hypothetical protein
MSDLVEIKKGEATLDVDFKEGKLRLSVSYDGKGADAGLFVDIDPDYFLDKLKAVIPGQIDDAIIEMLKGALK